MVIRNEFTNQEIGNLTEQLYDFIKSEQQLTDRKKSNIKTLIEKKSFYIAMEDNKVCGFIAKEYLAHNYYELKCWYVIPSHRSTGLSIELIKQSTSDTTHIYLGVTFQKDIIDKLAPYGFKHINLLHLPLSVLWKYIATRSWKSILKHLFKNKSYLLIKT